MEIVEYGYWCGHTYIKDNQLRYCIHYSKQCALTCKDLKLLPHQIKKKLFRTKEKK